MAKGSGDLFTFALINFNILASSETSIFSSLVHEAPTGIEITKYWY